MAAKKQDDTEWLKNYVSGSQTQQAPAPAKKEEDATQFLSNLTADVPQSTLPATTKQERLQKRAERMNAASADRLQKEKEKEEQDRLDAIEKKRQEDAQNLNARLQRGVSAVSSSVQPTIDKAGSLPTVGGIGLLLFILGVLMFLVVRVNNNGDTRAKQMWYMLTGRATLQGSVNPNVTTGSGSVASFGTTTPTGSATSFNSGPGPDTSSVAINPPTQILSGYRDVLDLGF